MPQNISIVDDSENDFVIDLLARELKTPKESCLASGKLSAYVECSKSSNLKGADLRLRIYSGSAYSTKTHKLRSPDILDSISASVALACLYGASRCLVELLKTWVEERNGRKLRITYNGKEINIEGGVSKSEIEEVIKILESEFGKSKELDKK